MSKGWITVWKNDVLLVDKHNITTNSGIEALVKTMTNYGGYASYVDSMEIGTGTNPATPTDTALQSLYNGIVGANANGGTSVSVALATTTVSNDTAVFTAKFKIGSTAPSSPITEAGLFFNDATPTMIARQVFDGITVLSNDIITVAWSIQL